ncbi:MAG: leucine-rich repeat domain-containing protein [Eubacterium sp.]|nr:leucine-rich repeat domain-containing protein [Eubacterium sp.]
MKRIISIILSLVISTSAVLCVDLSAFATELNISNRAEWLSQLTHIFDMTVEEDNYPDNYFSDLSSDSEYYHDILLAAEFGLINVEAGDPVNPNGDITREFASQTLNFCMGWTLEKTDGFEYSFADWEACAYPDDDQIAVEHKWISLDENNNFNPDRKLTADEITNMLSDAQKTIDADEIDGDYESTFKYNDDVIEILADTSVDFNDNNVVIYSTKYDINENDTFVVYSNNIPVIYTAKEVIVGDNNITITTAEDVEENAVENIDMQTVFDVDANDFIPAEGFEIVNESAAYSSLRNAKAKANQKTSIKLTKKIDLLAGNSINIDIKISNIRFETKQNTNEQTFTAKASFNMDFSVDGEFNFTDITSDLGDELSDIGTIPIAGIGYFEFKPELNFKGTTKLTNTYNVTVGFTKDKNGMHNISSFHKEKFSCLFEAESKFGVKVEVGATIVAAKVGIYADIGVKANSSYKITNLSTDERIDCVTLSAYLYFNVGVEFKINIVAWKFNTKVEWEIYKETNSPIRLYFHLENGEHVDECTAGNAKYSSPKDTKYGGINNTTAYNNIYTGLLYSIVYNKVTITGYEGSATTVIIPDAIDGCPVTSIGTEAFWNNTILTSITIPNSVTSIGNDAFRCCNLTCITIPSSVTYIGKGAFIGCTDLTSITVDSNNSNYSSQDGVLFNKEKTILVQYPTGKIRTNYTIPDSVTSIGKYAFVGCNGLTSITIPDGVTNIGEEAFEACMGLSSILIPDSVRYIDYSAFRCCENLRNVVIGNGVSYLSSETFAGCTNLICITIPESITSILKDVFLGCNSLSDVYYLGTKSSWNQVFIGNSNYYRIKEATIHCTDGVINDKTPHAHDYSVQVVAPTCSEQGYTIYTCSCGDTYNDDYVNALGHKYDNGVVTIAPSYVADGVKTYTCTVCGNQKIEKLAKLPKKANTLTVKAKKPTVKFAKLKKKDQTIALKKAMAVSKAQGTVTYKLSSAKKGKKNFKKYFKVAKNGKITVKKGLKKGTYTVKIKVSAAGNTEYNGAVKTVTIKIKVK